VYPRAIQSVSTSQNQRYTSIKSIFKNPTTPDGRRRGLRGSRKNVNILKTWVGAQCECMTSLPIFLRHLVEKRQEDIDDQAENFIDFEKGLDWTFGMVRHEGKKQTVERSN
jgi:hypothetical protein